MIRVLHCIETIASGGVEQVRLTLVRGLPKDQFEHRIICTWAGGAIAQALQQEGVEVIPIGSFRHPVEWARHAQVLAVIREFKPHIIHGAVFEGMSMAAIAGTIGRVPVRILEETSEPTTRSAKAIYLQRVLVYMSDCIIGISPSVCQFLREKAKIPNQKIKLVFNGVPIPDPDQRSPLTRASLGIQEEDFVLLAVGRVYNEVKRFSDILEAMALLSNASIKLLVIGEGPDSDYLNELAAHLGVSDCYLPLGYQAKPGDYFGLGDVLIVPSAHEGFGLVAAEGMMHGLPILASKVGGLKDIVVDGETGWLTPSKNHRLLAEKIQWMIDHPLERKVMGEKGRLRAGQFFSAAGYVGEVKALYLELLKQKRIHA